MIALLSDIHSNLYALEAVLNDMPKVSAVYVLGDTIGGANPFPCEVLDRLMSLDVPVHAVLGNWEDWMLRNRHSITPEQRTISKHRLAIRTMEALEERHWTFLQGLDASMRIDDVLIFHGRPENLAGYIGTNNQDEAEELVKSHDAKWLIGGHTHRARLFRVGSQTIINVGSVGLNCDMIGNTACYALLDGDNVVFRHVSYDVELAIRAIEDSEFYALDNLTALGTIIVMRSGNYDLLKQLKE